MGDKKKKKKGKKAHQGKPKAQPSQAAAIDPLLTAGGALQHQQRIDSSKITALLAKEQLVNLREQIRAGREEAREKEPSLDLSSNSSAGPPEKGNDPANYDYLMNLFNHFGASAKEESKVEEEKVPQFTEHHRKQKIDRYREETSQRVRTYIDKISSSRSPSDGSQRSTGSLDQKSSESSAVDYLKGLLLKRDLQKEILTKEDAQKIGSNNDAHQSLGGLLSSFKSTTLNTQAASLSTWQQQQRDELESMRERYLNLSCMEAESMTAVDMLNITYEYNRKQAIMQQMFDNRDNSSSSQSLQNEADFNILEELSPRAKDDPEPEGVQPTPGIRKCESRQTLHNFETTFEKEKMEKDFPGSIQDSLSEKLDNSFNKLDSHIIDALPAKSSSSSSLQSQLRDQHIIGQHSGAWMSRKESPLKADIAADEDTDQPLNEDEQSSMLASSSFQSSSHPTKSLEREQLLVQKDKSLEPGLQVPGIDDSWQLSNQSEEEQPVMPATGFDNKIRLRQEEGSLNSSKQFEIFKDEKIEQVDRLMDKSVDTDQKPEFTKRDIHIVDPIEDATRNDLHNTRRIDHAEKEMISPLLENHEGSTPQSCFEKRAVLMSTLFVKNGQRRHPSQFKSRGHRSGAVLQQQKLNLLSEHHMGLKSQKQGFHQTQVDRLGCPLESSDQDSDRTKNMRNKYQIMKVGQQIKILQQSSISGITYRSQSPLQSTFQKDFDFNCRLSWQSLGPADEALPALTLEQRNCLECFAPFSEEEESERRPVLLFCGDLLCLKCLKRLIEKQVLQIRRRKAKVSCPTCELPISVRYNTRKDAWQIKGTIFSKAEEQPLVSLLAIERIIQLFPSGVSSLKKKLLEDMREQKQPQGESTIQFSDFAANLQFHRNSSFEDLKNLKDEEETVKSEQVHIQIWPFPKSHASAQEAQTQEDPESEEAPQQKLKIFESRLGPLHPEKPEKAEDDLQKTLSLSDQFQGFTNMLELKPRRFRRAKFKQDNDDTQNTITAKDEKISQDEATPERHSEGSSQNSPIIEIQPGFHKLLPDSSPKMLLLPEATISERKRRREQRFRKRILKAMFAREPMEVKSNREASESTFKTIPKPLDQEASPEGSIPKSELTISQHSVKPCQSLGQSFEQASSERCMEEIVVDNQQESKQPLLLTPAVVNIREGVSSSSCITSSLDTPPLKAFEAANSSLSGLELQDESSSLSSPQTPKRKDLPKFHDVNYEEKQFAMDPLQLMNYSLEPELDFKPPRSQMAILAGETKKTQFLPTVRKRRREHHFKHLLQIQQIYEKEKQMDEQFHASPKVPKAAKAAKQAVPIKELLLQAAGLKLPPPSLGSPKRQPNSPLIFVRLDGSPAPYWRSGQEKSQKDRLQTYSREFTCKRCCPILGEKPVLQKRAKIIQSFLSLQAPMGLGQKEARAVVSQVPIFTCQLCKRANEIERSNPSSRLQLTGTRCVDMCIYCAASHFHRTKQGKKVFNLKVRESLFQGGVPDDGKKLIRIRLGIAQQSCSIGHRLLIV